MTTLLETGPDGKPRVHPESRADWRAWLEANHERREGVWLVSWRSTVADRPRMAYEDQILEALCFGWVDAVVNTLDAERAAIWMSPRRKGSVWSRPNKERVARLEAEGLMREPGRRVIERAKADGTWTILDGAEDGIVPDDLAAALAATPGAADGWDAYPRSVRKNQLALIAMAKRPETRAARVTQAVELAARGERPGAVRRTEGA